MLNHIGISGGKDSTALLLWAVHESGYEKETIVASFCDTGNEAQETYDFIKMLSETVHPITTLKPELDFWELARHENRFPSPRARFCTEDLKMKPTRDFMLALRSMGHEPLMHSGVRGGESAARAKLTDREIHPYFKCEVYRPLLNWTIDDVWAIHKKYNIEPNPLYAMGCKRVGCLPCIMSRKAEIANIATRWPERIAFIREQEGPTRNGEGFKTFFSTDKIPHKFRSKDVVTPDKKLKIFNPEGQEVMDVDNDIDPIRRSRKIKVGTVDDVVAWSMNEPDQYTDALDYGEIQGCDIRYGACE